MKPEKSRWNVLLLIQTLKRHTSAENPLSASAICDKVNEEYGYLLGNGEGQRIMSPDTVKRTLDDIVCGLLEMYKPEAIGLDYDICCVEKTQKGFRQFRYGDSDEKNIVKKYYYYESKFTAPQIRTLIDAVETHSYFSEGDVCDIVSKLIGLRPFDYQNREYRDKAGEVRIEDEDSLLLSNIDLLSQIIGRNHCAEIEYCAYNEKLELEVRPGYPKKVEPLTLMWSNGYYYMVAYNPQYRNTVNYRLDRIRDIKELEEAPAVTATDFNPVKYRLEHPIMYAGKKERCTILCRDTGKNYIVNTLMDAFGKNTKISPADEALLIKTFGKDIRYYEKQGIRWLKAVFEAVPDGLELWATQYCTDCVVVSPAKTAKAVKERLEIGLQNYPAPVKKREILMKGLEENDDTCPIIGFQ